MPENSASYDEIIAHFGEETIFNRYRFFFDKMQEYIKERNLESKLAVNETLLQHMIMDYFTDIFRLKMFHKIDRVNKAKIVAYEVYWILRRKPLQIKDFTTNESELEDEQKLAFANEGFSVTLIANEMLMPKETVPLAPESEDKLLDLLDQLYYHFKYRTVDKQSLETVIYAFDIGKQCASSSK